MLHFAKATGGASPINDDQGQAGVTIFGDLLLDGTSGGSGDTRDVSLYVFNDDNTYRYNAPTLSIVDTDPTADKSWFKFLDNKHVLGLTPTAAEWATYGVSGTLTMTMDGITNSGGLNPERKFWLRVSVPAGTATANLTGIKLKVASVQEAI